MGSQESAVILGLDVSYAQGQITWSIVPGEYQFVGTRLTCGTKLDTHGLENITGARAAGRRVFAYHYLTRDGTTDDQADAFLDALPYDYEALEPMLLAALDVEEGNADVAERALRWLEIVASELDVLPMIYTNKSFGAAHKF